MSTSFSDGSSSSSSLGLSNSDEEVEEGEEVNKGEVPIPVLAAVALVLVVVAPILVVSLGSKAANLVFPLAMPAVGEEVEHSFIRGGGADSSSEANMAPNPKNLGATIAPEKSKLAIQVHAPTVLVPISALPSWEASFPSSPLFKVCCC